MRDRILISITKFCISLMISDNKARPEVDVSIETSIETVASYDGKALMKY